MLETPKLVSPEKPEHEISLAQKIEIKLKNRQDITPDDEKIVLLKARLQESLKKQNSKEHSVSYNDRQFPSIDTHDFSTSLQRSFDLSFSTSKNNT